MTWNSCINVILVDHIHRVLMSSRMMIIVNYLAFSSTKNVHCDLLFGAKIALILIISLLHVVESFAIEFSVLSPD